MTSLIVSDLKEVPGLECINQCVQNDFLTTCVASCSVALFKVGASHET